MSETPNASISPDCYGGCVEQSKQQFFHYWYHVKSCDSGPDFYKTDGICDCRHCRAAKWLELNVLNGVDPIIGVSMSYSAPEDCTIIPVYGSKKADPY